MQGLTPLQPEDITAELERGLLPQLVEILQQRQPGHCMRLSDLDVDLMVRLCARLRRDAWR